MKKVLIILMISVLYSCKLEKEKPVEFVLKDMSFNKVVDWTGASSISYDVLLMNQTSNNIIFNEDNIKMKIKLGENYLKTSIRNKNPHDGFSLNSNDSIVLNFELDNFYYGKNLREMIDNNLELINSKYLLIISYELDDLKLVDTIYKNESLPYKLYLDDKNVSLNDSLMMNYYHEVPELNK